jgi:aspartyl-tRNA(Asn)/glutamyl-tRNA(Gln) amidotransferase subunit C
VSGIDRSTVQHVADLARIALTEDEVDRFTEQLRDVLTAIDQLRTVDTTGIPPTASVLPLDNVTRPDLVRPGLSREDALRNAPARRDGFFRVQPILEDRPDGS